MKEKDWRGEFWKKYISTSLLSFEDQNYFYVKQSKIFITSVDTKVEEC